MRETGEKRGKKAMLSEMRRRCGTSAYKVLQLLSGEMHASQLPGSSSGSTEPAMPQRWEAEQCVHPWATIA